MSPEELVAELAQGRLRPAYLLVGTEPLLRERALAALEEAVLGSGSRDFDLDRLDAPSVGAGELLDALRALPVLAPRRLVWLRDPDLRRADAKAWLEALADAVDEAREQEQTVLVVSAAKADRRSRWVKVFREPATQVSCAPPRRPRDVVAFVRQEAQQRELSLGPGAAEALAEAVGPELLLLCQELEKASLFAGPGQRVTREHVQQTVSDVAEEPIWDLTDAIGEGRASDALAVLQRLLHGGAPAPVVLGSLAGHFRKLLRVSSGGALSGHPFAVRKIESQATRYRTVRLEACLRAIHEADETLKGQGGIAPELALERLVIGLAA